MSPRRDGLDDYAAALRVYEAWLARPDREPAGELLDRNGPLRDILADMLEVDVTDAADPTETARIAPGIEQDFGPFRILELLGQGGMGAVYLAEHRELGRQVALKLLRPERLFGDTSKERFLREAKALCRLDHPNICPVYEVGEVDGVPFMSMRHVEGSTLAALVESGEIAGVEGDRVLEWFEKAARALQHAHERGIVHRDVKPGNIMIDSRGEPAVLDFGLARQLDGTDHSLTLTGDLLGTPLYMSPEQILPGGRKPDATSDVYSLGVTLYECVTGKRAFDGASVREVHEAILRADPIAASRENTRVPRVLDIVIGKAIDRDPMRRYRSALAFAEDLRRVRAREPIHARRAGPVLRLRRWTQRNPVLACFLLMLVVALAAVGQSLRVANRALAEYALASKSGRLNAALDAERALYPATPASIPRMEAWLHEYADLADDLASVRAGLAALEERKKRRALDDGARLRLDVLHALAPALERFARARGPLARVRRHLQRVAAEVTRERDDAHGRAWRDASAAIARSERYGFELKPQQGLVPLRANSAGFWEFVHVPSATRPDSAVPEIAGSEIVLHANNGIVFILVPAGTFFMGAQSADANGRNYDPQATPRELPLKPVEIPEPFFLGKHAVTQQQWSNLTDGELPSDCGPDRKLAKRLGAFTRLHPVEKVTWRECDFVLRQYGLTLPTEAQWEYACRAGTSTPWYTGKTRASLKDRVNIGDLAAKRAGFTYQDLVDWLDDRWPVHAPVNEFPPNPWGFKQMCGNVFEWCRDYYLPIAYDRPTEGPAALRRIRRSAERTIRGGTWAENEYRARSAYRRGVLERSRSGFIGLRAARPVL